MIINPSSLQAQGFPNDTIMSLINVAENVLGHTEQDTIYVSYQKDSEAWIICDNYDRGMFNAIRCHDNGRFTIWDVDEFKEYSYASEVDGNRITNYEAAYQHAKQFFTINSTQSLKGEEIKDG